MLTHSHPAPEQRIVVRHLSTNILLRMFLKHGGCAWRYPEAIKKIQSHYLTPLASAAVDLPVPPRDCSRVEKCHTPIVWAG